MCEYLREDHGGCVTLREPRDAVWSLNVDGPGVVPVEVQFKDASGRVLMQGRAAVTVRRVAAAGQCSPEVDRGVLTVGGDGSLAAE